MRVYFTVFIVTFNCSVLQIALSSPLLSQESNIISCTSEMAISKLKQDNDGLCCSEFESLYTACGIASTLYIQPNRQHVRVNLTHTTYQSMVQGVRLEVWRNAMDDCPLLCLTINTSKSGGRFEYTGNDVTFIECSIQETHTRYSIDVLPLFTDNIDVRTVRCQDIEVHLTYPKLDAAHSSTISTSHSSTPYTTDAFKDTVAKQQISLLPSAIVLLSIIFFVSMVTAILWYIFHWNRGRTLSVSAPVRSDDIQELSQHNARITAPSLTDRLQTSSSFTSLSAMEPQLNDTNNGSCEHLQYCGRTVEPSVSERNQDTSSMTSLPESFRAFIKNVNKET